MRRRYTRGSAFGPTGYTLVEILVATAIGLAIMAVMISLFTATHRMTHVGELSSALSEASMAMEIIHRDLIQAVQKPDPTVDRIVFVSKEAAQFIRGELRADGVLIGQLVVYRRETTTPGHFRLVRQIGGDSAPLPGVFSSVEFATLKGTGGPFVRVTLHVVSHDVASSSPVQGSDEAILTSLVRVAGPEMLGSPMLRWKFMDELKSVSFLKGTLGF